VFQNHRGEVVQFIGALGQLAFALALGGVDHVYFAGRDDAVRRKAFDRERPRNADAGFVLIGTVVEKFHVGFLGNRLVDFPLPRDALLPPRRMNAFDIG